MEIAFIMDPLESIDPRFETTVALMAECNERGHEVFFLEPHDLYVRANRVMARMWRVTVPRAFGVQAYWEAVEQAWRSQAPDSLPLEDLDVIFMRKDPPLNLEMAGHLQILRDRVFVINDPIGVVKASNKLYNLNFPDVIPETHVSRDPKRLRRVVEEFGGDMIVKPYAGHGGHGVIKVSTRDEENLDSLLHYYVDDLRPYRERNSVIVQEFLSAARQGDKRILLLDGEVLGAMRRIPKEGEIRANIHVGAAFLPCDVTAVDLDIIDILKPKLQADGLYFVGIDVIEDKLIEINVISPGGIPRINALSGQRLEVAVIDFVEARTQALMAKQVAASP
ncbi:MAG: glutathione synthase [bacterium]